MARPDRREPRRPAPAVRPEPARPPTTRPTQGRLTSLRDHLRVPLFRNAYALIGSTVLTTGLGMAASIAAARLYPVEEVGRGQSAINALILLSGLGNLRLMNVLTRFLPRARERTAWLVGRCYLLATGATLLACAIYLSLPDNVLPVEKLLAGVPYAGLWFTVAVLAFALFTLQDAVLTGVRRATWIPLENGLHSLLKLGLVVGLAGIAPATGIFVSWTVPTVLALVPVNLLIVRRLLPANAARAVTPEELSPRALAPLAAAEYAGALCELAVANLIPLIVAQRLGLGAAGVFAVAWLIGTTLDHVVVHFGTSLTVEGASDPAQLATLTRQLLRRSVMVVTPIAAVVVLGAPTMLRLFGPAYADQASGLLSLLGLALLPRLVCTVAVVVARVRSDERAVVGFQALLAAGTLAASIPLLDRMGIAGPGLAYLVSSVVVALVVTPWLLARLREAPPRHLPGWWTGTARVFVVPGTVSRTVGTPAAPAAAGPARTATLPVALPTRPDGPERRDPRSWPAVRAPERPRPEGEDRDDRVGRAGRRRTPSWRPEGENPDDQPARRRVPARLVGRPGLGALGSWLPLGLAVGLLALSLVQVDRDDAGGALGLLAVLPPTWWLGIATVTVSFAVAVVRSPRRHLWLLGHVVVLIVALHATPGLVESHGRFPTAWTHVGFVDHVVETGAVDPGYDARYNWPGAFSFGGLLVDLTGAESARSLVRFTPVVMNLLLLAPLAMLVRHVTRDDRLRWAALWLAVITNWVGQDYLAPQPLALLGYLAVVGVLLGWFRWGDTRTTSGFDLLGQIRRRVPRLVRDERLGETATPPPSARAGQEFGLVVAMVAIGAVLAFSHQLTPIMLVIATAVLVVTGRVDRPLVPLILAVCTVAWLALGTTSYLRSNLADLTGALGDVGSVVQENQSRVGPDRARQIVLATRLALLAIAGGLAALGFRRQWLARRADWALAGLAVAPVSLAALNSYGGEVLLRVSLFSLPFLALLGAFALFGEGSDPRAARRAGCVLVGLSALVLPLFVAARYGNEAFERIYDDDIAAWDYLVDNAPADSTVVVPDFAGPWRYSGLTRFEYRVYADEVAGEPTAAGIDRLVASGEGPGYLVLGTGSARYREVAQGYPPGWIDTLAADLVDRGRFEVVFEAGETRVLRRQPARAATSAIGAGP